MIADAVKQSQIQTLVQRINAKLFPDISVELLSGEDIIQAYRDFVGGVVYDRGKLRLHQDVCQEPQAVPAACHNEVCWD